jgi:hypothetical protein
MVSPFNAKLVRPDCEQILAEGGWDFEIVKDELDHAVLEAKGTKTGWRPDGGSL